MVVTHEWGSYLIPICLTGTLWKQYHKLKKLFHLCKFQVLDYPPRIYCRRLYRMSTSPVGRPPSPVAQWVKNPPAVQETQKTWVWSPGGGAGNSLEYSSLENPHGQRNLAGYSPQDRKVRHYWTTKHMMYLFSLLMQKTPQGISLAGQWLRLRLPVQRAQVQSPVGALTSHMPCGKKTKQTNKKKPQNIK